MSASRSIAMLASVLACLGAAAPEPQTPAAEDQPRSALVERVGVISVDVPVQVTLRGEPVRGLTIANFEIREGRHPREITGFRVVDLALVKGTEIGDTVPDLPMAGRRHFLLVFDLSFSDRGSVLRAQRHIREWIGRSLHPSDLVAVATFGVNSGAQLLINFTADRRQVDLAVASLGSPQLAERRADPLGLGFGVGKGSFLDAVSSESEMNGYAISWDDDQVGGLSQEVFYGAFEPTQYAAQRFPVRRLAREFGGLARLLDSVKGRKHVVYLSEGIDSELLFATDDVTDISALNEAVQHGELWLVESTKRFGSGTTQSVIAKMLEDFRRSDCVIQAVDLKSHETVSTRRVLPASTDTLGYMAHETGGEVYRSYANLNDALDRLLNVTSVTYLLSFNPRDVEPDGGFHKIKVKLLDAPDGARPLHRPGYFAPQPHGERAEPERRLIAGQLLLEGREGGRIDTSVLATAYQGGAPRTRVPVLVEIDGPTLALGKTAGSVALEIYAYAFDAAGELSDFLNQSMALDLSRVGPMLAESGLKFFGELDLDPGEYSLRILVLDRDSGESGLTIRRLTVPDLDTTAPILLAPLFPEPRGKWLLARESDLQREPRSFPFLIADEPYLPAASPSIPVRTSVPLHLLGYNLAADVRALGRVFAVDGREVKQMDLRISGRAVRDDAGPDTLMTAFSTSGLKAGLYTLVISILDAEGGPEQSVSIALNVTRS